MKKEVLSKSVHLFKPNATTRWETLVTTGGTNRRFAGTNPTPGAHIYYWLADKAEKVSLKVLDVNGDVLFSYPTVAKDGKEGEEPAKGGKGGEGGKGGKGGGVKGGQPVTAPKAGLNKVTWSTFLPPAVGKDG